MKKNSTKLIKQITALKACCSSVPFILLLFSSVTAFCQATFSVDVPCTGSTNPNSGRINYNGTSYTKSYGYLWHGVSQENRGWARFNINSYVPANATITAAEVTFWVETSSGAAGNNYLRFFTGDPGSLSAANVWTAIGQTSAHEASNADLNPAGQKTRGINAAGITFLNNNIANIVNLGFTRGVGNFGFRIHGADGVGQNSTDINKRPVLKITYTLPCTIPAIPASISGTSNICGTGNQNYSVTPVGGATGYTWSVSGGGNVAGGQGTTNATINWTTAGTYTVSVTADTSCGSSQPRTLIVNVTGAVPTQPASFSTSSNTVCQGQNNVAYTVPAVSGATSYNWAYSGTGATINGSGNSVTVNFSSSATGGTLSVAAVNFCGAGTDQTLNVTVNTIPEQPTSFTTSTATVCASQSAVAFEVPAVSGATSYTWTYSGSGATINGTSNSTSVDFSGAATSGTLSVAAVNGCGTGTAQTTSVAVNSLPTIPSVIAGPTALCSNSTSTYSVVLASGADYVWTLPTGWLGSSTTNSIGVTANTLGGDVQVIATNNCGNSSPSILSISVDTLPLVTLNSFAAVCIGDAPFALSGGSPAGGSYFVDGNTATQFTPSTGAGTYTISYTFTDGNNCNATASETQLVDICTALQEVTELRISIYPNPALSHINIESGKEYSFKIYDALGKFYGDVVASPSGTTKVDLSNFGSGICFIKIFSENICVSQSKISVLK
jgi:hypothetical protein